MWLMLARASPRKPYVAIEVRSSNFCSLDVVKRSQRMGRSSFCDAVSRAGEGDAHSPGGHNLEQGLG